MSWVKIDDGFAEHPKIVSLTDRELRIWIGILCHCARQQDPTVDIVTIKNVRGLTPRFVSKLVSLSLLDKVGNAHEIHDWIHYQPKDKTGAERQARYRARRLEQAEPDRYAAVTPTVTEPVTPDRYSERYESVTPVPVPGQTPTSSVSELPPSTEPKEPARDPSADADIDFDTPTKNGRWNTAEDMQTIGQYAEEGGR